MTTMRGFEPNWACAPGATVLDLMEERGYTVRSFAEAIHCDVHRVSRLVYGVEKINENWAQHIASTFGSTPGFWLRREQQYREDLARLSAAAENDEANAWLAEVPLSDMTRFGWIDAGKSKQESLVNALAFFGVASIDSWRSRYESVLAVAAYRSSAAYETRPAAVAAWLRQGEILASEYECVPWDASACRAALADVKKLTRLPDPGAFIPRLVQVLAQCGVAVVIARAPNGCRASGATKFVSSNKALMLLSFRYLADDQFWFTVFHEIGHLLLHAHDGVFLEGVETTHAEAERQADDFAMSILFPGSSRSELATLPLNKFAIARFARQLGVSSGIVVSQLQELGRVPYKHFNYMKVRYAWTND